MTDAHRHALIVGGTRGLGRMLAERWAQTDRCVSAFGRTIPAEFAALSIAAQSVDLRSTNAIAVAIQALLAEHGPVDDLILMQRAREVEHAWDDELAVALTASQTILSAMIPSWKSERQPSVVVVTSLAGRLVAGEQGPDYHVAKAGLEQLMRYYAVTLGPQGVRVNGVAPGIVMKPSSKLPAEQLDAYLRATPLRRLVEPEEVFAAIEFLGSPAAASITGQTLVLDGGLSLQMPHSLAAAFLSHRPD